MIKRDMHFILFHNSHWRCVLCFLIWNLFLHFNRNQWNQIENKHCYILLRVYSYDLCVFLLVLASFYVCLDFSLGVIGREVIDQG